MLVFNLTDQVRETIQQTLYRLLTQRRNAFLAAESRTARWSPRCRA